MSGKNKIFQVEHCQFQFGGEWKPEEEGVPLFKYKCPLEWENLAKTQDEKIRFCGECKRKVHFCESDEEFIKNARRGNCVVIEREQLLLGEPNPRVWDMFESRDFMKRRMKRIATKIRLELERGRMRVVE